MANKERPIHDHEALNAWELHTPIQPPAINQTDYEIMLAVIQMLTLNSFSGGAFEDPRQCLATFPESVTPSGRKE